MKNKKLILLASALWVFTALACCIAAVFITKSIYEPGSAPIYGDYELSVRDAVHADPEEIMSLVTVTKDSDMVSWDQAGERVLMLSWHKYPDSYPDGGSFDCSYGEVWVFTDREMLAWYNDNSEGVTDWELRFKQLIGLPESSAYTHFTAFWVEPRELIRPAYLTDITRQLTESDLKGEALGEHEEWFDQNILGSYFEENTYPWTRLGYTYDWTNDGRDYGLTEFIILPGSTVEVEWTVSTAEFLSMLASGSLTK